MVACSGWTINLGPALPAAVSLSKHMMIRVPTKTVSNNPMGMPSAKLMGLGS